MLVGRYAGSVGPEPSRNPAERPRDRYGRPLPWGAVSELPIEDFAGMTPAACHDVASEHFAGERYFLAHEAWEAAWNVSKGSPHEALFKALAQLGAAYTHVQRGNPRGARILLARARENLRGAQGGPFVLDVPALDRALGDEIERLSEGSALEPPALR